MHNNDSRKILQEVTAIIVTYNRRELLCQCLASISQQSHPVRNVIVVDNASIDNSESYIRAKGWFEKLNLQWLRLPENEGGAGGFHNGLKASLSSGCQFVWLMDDDGHPEKDCLEKLLDNIAFNEIIGPIVLNTADTSELSFPFRKPRTKHVLNTTEEIQKLYGSVCNNILFPFNGTLLSIETIKKIGLPKKEYFIWGDEIEYTLRAKRFGTSVRTINSAKFYHPKSTSTSMFFGLMKFTDGGSDLKRYCFVRNNLRNMLDYSGLLCSLAFLAKVFWFYSFTRPNLRNLKIALLGTYDCLFQNFSRHKNFINTPSNIINAQNNLKINP